jgi:hypothetical protein
MRRGIKKNDEWRRLKNQTERGNFIGIKLKTRLQLRGGRIAGDGPQAEDRVRIICGSGFNASVSAGGNFRSHETG